MNMSKNLPCMPRAQSNAKAALQAKKAAKK
jgi:hypothetical protein